MKAKEIPVNIGEYLKYDESSQSCLRWIKLFGRSRNIKIGDVAGSKHHTGYFSVRFNGITFQTHRIIFFLHNGYCPDVIDHIDGNPSNNIIDNLREATFSENNSNTRTRKDNFCSRKGVSKHTSGNYWYVGIQKNKKRFCKYFSLNQFQEACDYADSLRERLHGDFANNGSTKYL